MTVTSRDIIRQAMDRYRRGAIGDDTFIHTVLPVTSVGGAQALLDMLKRERRPSDGDVIEGEYRIIEGRYDPNEVEA